MVSAFDDDTAHTHVFQRHSAASSSPVKIALLTKGTSCERHWPNRPSNARGVVQFTPLNSVQNDTVGEGDVCLYTRARVRVRLCVLLTIKYIAGVPSRSNELPRH